LQGRAENFTDTDRGGFEITILFASLTNTVPNTFSMLCYILSNPLLTAEVCKEVERVVTRKREEGRAVVVLDFSALIRSVRCLLAVSMKLLGSV
jgi:hypothetical protein